jgi:glycosyl hydrolase family 114/Kelch motif protein
MNRLSVPECRRASGPMRTAMSHASQRTQQAVVTVAPNQFAYLCLWMVWLLLGIGLLLVLARPAHAQTPGNWSPAGTMSTVRGTPIAAVLADGTVLVVGGASSAAADLYDPVANSWTTTAPMSTARNSQAGTLLADGRVLVVGGQDANGVTLASAEIYDPGTKTWTPTGSMTTPRYLLSASLLPNGQVLVAGGWASTCCFSNGQPGPQYPLTSSELWNPATGTWTATGSMANPHAAHTATVLSSGSVLVAGGQNYGQGSILQVGVSAAADLYDPASGTWTSVGNMTTPRDYAAAALRSDGRVLEAGGSSGGCCAGLWAAEIFDPTTLASAAVQSMTIGRNGPAASAISNPNGVLVSGGYSCCSSPNPTRSSAEYFDLVAQAWHLTGSLSQARAFHTSVTLQDGTVLAVGGGFSSAERYYPNPADQSVTIQIFSTGVTPIPYSITGTGCSPGAYTAYENLAVNWNPGSSCQVTASAPSGWSFISWADGPTANPRTFIAPNAPTTYVANFSQSSATPASISATGGTPQSAAVNTTFASPLVATVRDSGGNPVNGVTVTFAAPGSGASGTFAGGVTTAITNASGKATSATFTANATVGSYRVRASVAGVSARANFALTNTGAKAASISATGGTPQSATVNTTFASPLVATVKDSAGSPVSGVTVTFTAPSGGASGTFAGGVNTATTNASGVATSAAFTANATPGNYTVTASVAGVSTPANFALTNTGAKASSISATGGTPQSATVNTAFASPLVATVKDSGGSPVSGVTVTFATPTSGASGTFAGGVNTATTNASGVATSAAFTANATAGSYTVTASVAGVSMSASFALTNKVGSPASVTATGGTPQSATVNTAFASPLAVTVKDSGGNLLSGVTVNFAAPGSGASGTFAGGVNTATTNASGVATSAAFTANATAGSYTVTASVASVSTSANFALTNNAASGQNTFTTLVPLSYVTTAGTTGGQPVATSIDLLDESSTASDWNKYVEFQGKYTGYQVFTLPTSIAPSAVKSIQIQVNYQGPATASQTWTWQIYDWVNAAYVTVGTNAGAPDWGAWKLLTFTVPGTLSNYIRSSDGQIRVQLVSNNSADAADIDYEAVIVGN